MPHGTYQIGPATRPGNITHDNGFLDGFHTPRNPTPSDYARLALWRTILAGAESVQHVPGLPHNSLPDALAAYRHFLNGNGQPRTFSYERYVSADQSGRTTLENSIIEAREAAELLYQERFAGSPTAHFEMTGSGLGAGSPRTPWFPYPQTENWQKAIGAHWLWISAVVDVVSVGGRPQFSMVMTLHIEDRYNFNPGAQDINTGVTDQQNGELELSGLGRQYTNYSTLTRNVAWMGGALASSAATVSGAPTNRQRQPQDNVRGRNRI